jgi:hypothetical protein
MKYVSWHSEQDGKSGLFPAFHELDPIVGDLVAGVSFLYYVMTLSLTLP